MDVETSTKLSGMKFMMNVAKPETKYTIGPNKIR